MLSPDCIPGLFSHFHKVIFSLEPIFYQILLAMLNKMIDFSKLYECNYSVVQPCTYIASSEENLIAFFKAPSFFVLFKVIIAVTTSKSMQNVTYIFIVNLSRGKRFALNQIFFSFGYI